MKRLFIFGMLMVFVALTAACGSKVMIPPRIDLKQHEIVGIVDFKFSFEGELGVFATRKFTEKIRQDQGIIRIVQLGPENEVLKSIRQGSLSQAAFRELGKEREINTVITGELIISGVRPNVGITPGFGYIGISAEVDATLTVQLIETSTGASLWSSSASETKSLGSISIFEGRDIAFNADDPEKAYGKLVNSLVNEVTKDFRITRERR
ncbi:MAG: hypothetical protein ACYC9O_09750 [Candidatus Latescibacterota bacterium]